MKPINIKLSNSPQSSFKYKWIELEFFEFNWHFHPEYELMLMHKSSGKRFIGDNIAYYNEGDLFLIGKNLPHTWYTPSNNERSPTMNEAILIQFLENLAGLDMARIPELQYIDRLLGDAARGIQFHGTAKNIAAEKMLAMNTMTGLRRFMHLFEILDLLGRAAPEEKSYLSSLEFTSNFRPDAQSRIDRVCIYLNENYQKKLRLEDVANIANMSVTAFSRFFKKSTGKTFIKYVNELRIGKACRLLIESEMTIAEICYAVGFNNISNFNRRFCERHQISPKKYRQEFSAKFRTPAG